MFVQLPRASERDPGRPRRIHTFHSSQRRGSGEEEEEEDVKGKERARK